MADTSVPVSYAEVDSLLASSFASALLVSEVAHDRSSAATRIASILSTICAACETLAPELLPTTDELPLQQILQALAADDDPATEAAARALVCDATAMIKHLHRGEATHRWRSSAAGPSPGGRRPRRPRRGADRCGDG